MTHSHPAHPGAYKRPELQESVEASRGKLLRAIDPGRDVTLVRVPGNIGDELIQAGTRRLLANLPYREISVSEIDAHRGELALLVGGGSWCKAFHAMPVILRLVERRFEDVVVLPSSFDPSVDAVREALSNTRAHVFAREEDSYRRIRDMCRADLAHDCAFYFDFDTYQRPGQGELIAYRTDAESSGATIPSGNNDISFTCSSLDEWLWTIARHERVCTDRAHVMIAAAMLGKPVDYRPSNYHKLPAIVNFSLSGLPIRRLDENSVAEPKASSVSVPGSVVSSHWMPSTVQGTGSAKAEWLAAARASLERLPDGFLHRHVQPEVTVVMLNFGATEQTRKALAALTEHVQIPIQVLVIDNGSGPDVQQELEDLRDERGNFQLWLLPTNLGCAGGRTRALDAVVTPYVLFVDNDMEVQPGAVEHLLARLEANPDLFAAAGKVVFPDGRVHLFGADYQISDDGVLHFDLLGSNRRFDDPDLGSSRPCTWVGGASMFRTAPLRLNGFQTDLTYYEDLELCYRLNIAGEGRFERCADAILVHDHHDKRLPTEASGDDFRRSVLPLLDACARVYRTHDIVVETVFGFIPELGAPSSKLSVAAAKLALDLFGAVGSSRFLNAWCAGRLTPLFVGCMVGDGLDELPGELVNAKSELALRGELVSSLCTQLLEQLRWSRRSADDVAIRDAMIHDLQSQLNEQTSWALSAVANVEQRDQTIRDRDATIRNLQLQLEEQTAWAVSAVEDVKQRDEIIRELQLRRPEKAPQDNMRLLERLRRQLFEH